MFPIPRLDPDSEEPIYRQLSDSIRNEILAGRLARGSRIPPTRELAGLLGLNRTTVAAAYELLEQEGLIRGHVGRGSFVAGAELPAEPGQDWPKRFASPVMPDPLPVPAFPDGDGISFTSARPAQQLFPLGAFRETCADVISSSDAAGILQLGSPYGYAPLRDYLRLELETNGLHGEGDDLLITNGCQQAIDLLHRLFCSPGDVVAIEDPVYPGLRNVFSGGAARVAGVAVGDEGVEVEALERVLSREHPKMLVVTPNFQNPTGATMPLAARQALLRMARDAGTIVVENDVYGDLRYFGASVPTLKELDAGGGVIQIKSYSKVAFPGLRVGWVVGPASVIARLAELRQRADLHGDQLSQAVLLRFAESGRLAQHREKILAAGRERLSAVLDACAAHLPEGSAFTRPEGGMNLWVRLPEPLDAADLLPRAVRAGVSYLPGRYFAVARAAAGALRLSFAGLPPEQIRSGLSTLGRLFQAESDRVRATRRDAAPAIV